MIFVCVASHMVFVGTKHAWINLSAHLAPKKTKKTPRLLLFFVVRACVCACACLCVCGYKVKDKMC